MAMSLVQGGGSLRFERLYGSVESRQPERSGRAGRRKSDDGDAGEQAPRGVEDGPVPRNPLVGALMQALKGLVPARSAATSNAATASASTSTASPTTSSDAGTVTPATDLNTASGTAATATAEATNNSGDLKDAAYAFAHELFSALRSLGDDGESGSRGHHHGHHHGGGHGDYGDLAQGLQQLANALSTSTTVAPAVTIATSTVPPATSATATTAAPSSTATTATDTAATPDTAAVDNTTAAPAATGASVSINISIDIKFNVPAATATPAQGADSPLLAAFKRLTVQLNPASTGSTSTSADSASLAEKLKTFLLTMADTLKLGRSDAASTRPPVGSLLNLAA